MSGPNDGGMFNDGSFLMFDLSVITLHGKSNGYNSGQRQQRMMQRSSLAQRGGERRNQNTDEPRLYIERKGDIEGEAWYAMNVTARGGAGTQLISY